MSKKVVLVHGLGGTKDGTWGRFPEFLKQDVDLDVDVIQLGYESPHILFEFLKRAPGILNIANGLLTELRSLCDLENDELIIAGHSLGGVIVKKMLLRLKAQGFHHNIKKVCFFDVPHDGSGYANVCKILAFRNRHLKSLSRDSGELDDLNEQWTDQGFDSIFDVLSVICANDAIVSSNSAKSIFRNHPIETVNNVNHKSIVKPKSQKDQPYVIFKKFIQKEYSIARYRNIASRSLSDWMQVDGRNHGFNFVCDDKRAHVLDSLVAAIGDKQSVIRLTGASGLGKSRLLIEAINVVGLKDDNVLVFDHPDYDREVRESIRLAVDADACGLVVVDKCKVDLHEDIQKEVAKAACSLNVVTIGYSHEQVETSIHLKLEPLADEAITSLLSPILVDMDKSDVERIARFAQGYPLLAVMLANQYLQEGSFAGSISSNSLVRKLIEGDGGVSESEREMLSACSLFDVFGVHEGGARDEAKFIAEHVAKQSIDIFDKVIARFSKRQIINCAGRYARVVPKPLALTLAAEWWEETGYDRQLELIDGLPESLFKSFCVQVSYLDRQPNVKRFTEKIYAVTGPFGKAEVLFTEKGSRLFRELVEVNPDTLCHSLYCALKDLNHDELKCIEGETRRNLIWGLEKLCFHVGLFDESAWSLLLLASAENESWSNNATGIFKQLYHIRLSGNTAEPSRRFALLDRAMEENRLDVDVVVIEALESAISTHGGTRTIGAEYQGTKAPLQEWAPSVWKDIFDYWQTSFDLLLLVLKRGDEQKDKVMSAIGYSIRGFVQQGRIEMLDRSIRDVVGLNGPYWPSALESIKHAFEYDSDGLEMDSEKALESWLELLSPENASMPEKLKIIVIDPPWENKEGEDGNFADIAAENAKCFATEVAQNIELLYPYIDMLLLGEQKQSYWFGRQLAIELSDRAEFLNVVLDRLKIIKVPNLSFVLGIYNGINEVSEELWQQCIDRILGEKSLIVYYSDFVRTGEVQECHLEKLHELIVDGDASVQSANSLSYGRAVDSIATEAVERFCLNISAIGDEGAWTALNIMFMYCFVHPERVEGALETIRTLVIAVPLDEKKKQTNRDIYHWREFSKKLLSYGDQNFAVSLTRQLLATCSSGFGHSDIWNYIKPLFNDCMKQFSTVLWPLVGDSILRAEGMERYWLQQLLERENSFSNQQPSIFSAVVPSAVISWCLENPDLGPVFVAESVNVFELVEEEKVPSALFIALLEQFGDDDRVARALAGNLAARGWTGSLVPYLESDKTALSPLLEHKNPKVAHWVRGHIARIEKQIEYEATRDEEERLGVY